MRVFLITALWATLAHAKPQYNYPAPSIPSTPSGSYGTPGGGGGIGIGTGGGGSIGGFGGGSSSGFGGGSSSGFGGGSSSGIGGGSSSGFGGGSGSGFGGGSSSGFGGGSGSGFGGGGGVGFSSGGGGGTLVQKHIYVHVAPPEPEEVRPQRPIASATSTKHYKIIFIKAPSYDVRQQQILQAQAQNEEKTLVYVLVKKPDDVADITLPTVAPTAPSKPEVYFIRYKAKSEVTGGTGIATGGPAYSTSGSGSGVSIGGTSLTSSTSGVGSIGGGRPSSNYGPPGQSGPY